MDKRLEQWSEVFRKAVNFDFIHLSASEFQTIASLYTEFIGKQITKSQMNCNSCRLKVVKELAVKYFQLKEEEDKNKQSQIESPNAKKAKRNKGRKVTE